MVKFESHRITLAERSAILLILASMAPCTSKTYFYAWASAACNCAFYRSDPCSDEDSSVRKVA